MLPNLIGNIVILQLLGRFEPARLPEPYICVGQTDQTITVTGTNGGFGSRVLTFNTRDVEVLGFFVSLEVVEQQLKMIAFSLNNELLTITTEGRHALLESQTVLAKVLEEGLRTNTEQSRAAEDYRTNRYRAEEDEAREAYFAQYRPAPTPEPPVNGATFSEQAFADHPVQAESPLAPVVNKVKVHVVIEHQDPAIVKQVAARVRAALNKVTE